MARALTLDNEKIKMAALKLAHADVILPDQRDEIFANEAGRMSCGCSKASENHLRNLGVTAPADLRSAELD